MQVIQICSQVPAQQALSAWLTGQRLFCSNDAVMDGERHPLPIYLPWLLLWAYWFFLRLLRLKAVGKVETPSVLYSVLLICSNFHLFRQDVLVNN